MCIYAIYAFDWHENALPLYPEQILKIKRQVTNLFDWNLKMVIVYYLTFGNPIKQDIVICESGPDYCLF